MRKCLFLFMLCSLISSCSVQDDYKKPTTEVCEVDYQLIDQLQDYNNSVANQSRTRGSGRKGAILVADIAGGVVGMKQGVSAGRWILTATGGTGLHLVGLGVLGWTVFKSACASHMMYKLLEDGVYVDDNNRNHIKNNLRNKTLFNRFNNDNENNVTYVDEDLVINNDSVYDSIGHMHNNLLSEVWNSPKITPISNGESNVLFSLGGGINIQGHNTMIEDDIIEVDPIDESQYEMNSYGISTISDDFVELYFSDGLQGLRTLYITDDYESFLDDLQSENYMSQNVKSVIKLLYETLMESVYTEHDLNDRIDTYKTYVNNATHLSISDKQLLYQSLEIARYSFNYWSSMGLL